MFLQSSFLLPGYHQPTLLLAARKDDFSWVALSDVQELEIIWDIVIGTCDNAWSSSSSSGLGLRRRANH